MKNLRGSLIVAALSLIAAIVVAGGSPVPGLSPTAETATTTGTTATTAATGGAAATDLTGPKKKCKDANDAVTVMIAAVDAWGKYDPSKTKYDDLKAMAKILLDHKEKGIATDLSGGFKPLKDAREALNTAANPAGQTPSADPEVIKILKDADATLGKKADYDSGPAQKIVDGGVAKAKPVVAGKFDDLAATYKGFGFDSIKAPFPGKGKTVSDNVDGAEHANDAIANNADGMAALATSYSDLNDVLSGLNAADGPPAAPPATNPTTPPAGTGDGKDQTKPTPNANPNGNKPSAPQNPTPPQDDPAKKKAALQKSLQAKLDATTKKLAATKNPALRNVIQSRVDALNKKLAALKGSQTPAPKSPTTVNPGAAGGNKPTASTGGTEKPSASAGDAGKPAAPTGGAGGGDKPAATTGGGGDKPSDDPDKEKAAFAAAVGGLNGTVSDWIKLQPYALDQISQDFHATIKKGLEDENLTPDLESDMIRTRAFMPKAAAMDGSLDAWIAALKKLEVKTDQIEAARPCLKKVADLSKILNGYLAILDDAVGGLGDDTEQEAIQLFYFGSVPEAMKALNLNASQYTDTYFGASSNLDKLRTDLLGKEADARKALAETNELIYHVSEIQAQITRDMTELQTTTSQVGDWQSQINRLVQQKVATTDPRYTAANTGLTTSTTEQSRLQDELTKDGQDKQSLQSQLMTAQAASATAVKSRNELNIDISILASKEVDAFAFERDHHPFWFTMPRKTSADPVKRCLIFGYDNSNVIFVRGAKNDLSAVKEILASFDRPAPQAKITLYSLQINGSNASKIAENISDVKNELNVLEGNMTILQDVLRNAIAKEVARQSRLSRIGFTKSGQTPPFSERVWRSFYYPREIRRQLGLDVQTVPSPKFASTFDDAALYDSCSAMDDIDQAEASFKAALNAQVDASNYDELSRTVRGANRARYLKALASARLEREINLTRTGYYFSKALKSMSGHGIYLENFKSKKPKEAALDSMIGTVQTGGYVKGPSVEPLARLAKYGSYLDYLVRNSETSEDEYAYALRVSEGQDLFAPAEAKDTSALSQKAQSASLRVEPLRGRGYKNEYLSAAAVVADATNVVASLKHLIQAEQAQTLSVSPDYARSTDYVTKFTLPDPAHGTTLGEMLFVLSLGSRESRERILHDLSQELFDSEQRAIIAGTAVQDSKGILAKLEEILSGSVTDPNGAKKGLIQLSNSLQYLYGNTVKTKYLLDTENSLYPYFPRTILGSMGPGGDDGPAEDSLTPNQKEILSAIQTRVREIVSTRIEDICDMATAQRQSNPNLNVYDYVDQVAPLVGWLSTSEFGPNWRNVPTDDYTRGYDQIGLAYLKESQMPMPARRRGPPAPHRPDATPEDPALGWVGPAHWLASRVGEQNALSKANPRVAAADDMIKRFITVLEGDLDHFLVSPSMERIRRAATARGVEFGGMEEESILATNRFVARVDVNASASLGSGEAQATMDISNQLAAIQNRLNEKTKADVDSIYGATATLGAAAAKSETKGANLGSIAKFGLFGGLLGGLFSQPEPIGEVYSLSGGSQFKVTPIFDPSGQAMRFRFDHVQTTELQDPRGTRDPLLPRVDRHTINTEVQLSNGQFQVISNFDLNYKVGSPPRRGGGIPPFNQIPILRDIPILGYYTRSGEAAVRQHSLIFASTVMYPTVGDIVNLLVESPPSRGRSYVLPQPKKKKRQETPPGN